jgi:arylsulfatase A-like enzyme
MAFPRRCIAILVLIVCCFSCVSNPRSDPPPPNIVVISLDTLRAKSLGTYGYGRDTSPFFDSLAARGVLFENAITTSTTTPPSHMSLFTGLTPRRHGMISGLGEGPVAAPRLAMILADRGYQTKAITENGFLIRDRGFDTGFSEYSEYTGKHQRSAPGLVNKSFGEARRWLGETAAEPFFLFVHTYQVHSPYLPPPRYRQRFREEGPFPTADLGFQSPLDRYDQEIAYVDDELKALFASIESRRTSRGTVVIVLSDHGEEFMEHGATQHGAGVFEETIRIPLLFWGTGIPEGRRVDRQVSLLDVFPTLLEMAGASLPPQIDGASLLPAIAGDADPPARPLFVEAMAPRRWVNLTSEPARPLRLAVRFDTRKFIVHRPTDDGPRDAILAFDLKADPGEQHPIEVASNELEWIDRLADEYLAQRREGEAEAGAAAAIEADPALVERLRSLGYIE